MMENDIIDLVNNNLITIISGQTGKLYKIKDVVNQHRFHNFFMNMDMEIQKDIILE